MTASEILYRAAGSLGIPDAELASGSCWLCGASLVIGVPLRQFVKSTFMDRDKVANPAGTHVCPACAFSFQEQSEELARRVGKDKAQRMRNYSHFVANGEWHPLSKAQKSEMRRFLLEERPELAVVAVSGQKHLVFRGTPGWWQVEEQAMLPDPLRLELVLLVIEDAYQTFSKSEIGAGRYKQHRILKFGVERWDQLESQLREWRGSALFELALFLAQKEA